jgi:hypothetical protein
MKAAWLSKTLFLVILAGIAILPGCARSLFRDSPRARNNIDKYYNGDSATAANDSSRRAAEMGFGFPTGPQ